MDDCEDYLNKFLDCETGIIFTKDPQYIVNAHSWPDEIKKKEKEKKEKEKQDEKRDKSQGRKAYKIVGGVNDLFKKKPGNEGGTAPEDKEVEEKSKQIIQKY